MSEPSQHTQIDLLRHGQLAIKGILCAGQQAVVSDEGIQNLIDVTKNSEWDVIISSPQDRCRLFAKKLAEKKQTSLIIDPRFKELNFGDWIDSPSDRIWKEHPEEYQKLWQNPDDFIAPNGESMKAFNHRVQQGLDEILKQYQTQSILLITHAGVIRSILSKALAIEMHTVLKFNIGYAQITQLHHYADGNYSLQSLGKTV